MVLEQYWMLGQSCDYQAYLLEKTKDSMKRQLIPSLVLIEICSPHWRVTFKSTSWVSSLLFASRTEHFWSTKFTPPWASLTRHCHLTHLLGYSRWSSQDLRSYVSFGSPPTAIWSCLGFQYCALELLESNDVLLLILRRGLVSSFVAVVSLFALPWVGWSHL